MTDTLQFEIPAWVEDVGIADFIEENFDQYMQALDLTSNPGDPLCELDDAFVSAVYLEPGRATIQYIVDYSAWHGCEALSYAGSHYREVIAEREGRTLTFKKLWEVHDRQH